MPNHPLAVTVMLVALPLPLVLALRYLPMVEVAGQMMVQLLEALEEQVAELAP